MALVSLDELEAASPGAKSLGFNPAVKSVVRTEEDFEEERRKAAEIAERSIIGAAFQEDNTVASFFSSATRGASNKRDPEFDFGAYIKDNGLEGQADLFTEALNKDYADGLLADLRRKETNRETLAAAGWAGTFASIAAGTLDLPTLLPGGAIVKGAKGGYSIGKTALLGSVSAAAGAGVAEAALQDTQTGRTAEESYINIGASILLGGMLGGAAAALMSKGERAAAEAALERLFENTAPGGAIQLERRATESIGAAVNPDAPPNYAFDLVGREDLAVAGKDAAAIVKTTKWLNPVLRATDRFAGSARQFGAMIYDNTIYRTMHAEGKSLGASAEAAARTNYDARNGTFLRAMDENYKAARKAGYKGNRDNFARDVGMALHMGDEGTDPFVSAAAAAVRKEVIDPYTKEALATQRADGSFLLNEGDLDLKGTAKSYAPTIYNIPTLRGQETQFVDAVSERIAKQLQEANTEETAALQARLDNYATQIADMQAVGTERAAKIDEIKALGDGLDNEFADVRDLADDLTEATAASRAAETTAEKAAAREAAKTARDAGGERLQEYLKRRADLRRRRRNLTRDNADAQAAKRAQVEDRIEQVQEQDAASVKVFARRMKNIINTIDKNLPGRAQELLDGAIAEVERLNKLLAASEKRVAALSKEPGEQPEGLAAYIAGERAAAEQAARAAQDLVDQMQDIAARGVTDADYDDLRAALDLKPVAGRGERTAKAEKNKVKREGKLDAASGKVDQRQLELANAQRLAADLEEKLNAVAEGVSARSTRRGEYLQRAKDRAAKLTPEEVAAQSRARIDLLNARRAQAEARFQERWIEKASNEPTQFSNRAERFPFENAGRAYAQEIFDKITGRAAQDTDIPPGVVKYATGPLKARTFLYSREELAARGWLETDVRQLMSRWGRSMASDIELTRRFGRADMREQIATVNQEYSEMTRRVQEAADVKEINTVLGRKFAKEGADLETVKRDASIALANDRDGAIEDMQAGRDLMRGDYARELNSGNFGAISRSLLGFNYLLRMGGVALSSVQEIFRPAMAHGLRPYLKALPAALNKGGEATRLLRGEAQKAGLIVQRITNALMVANSDLGDPYVTRGAALEGLIHKGTQFASKWNGINLLTDAQQAVAAVSSQHRIIETVLGRAGTDGSFVRSADEGKRMLAMLGVDERTAAALRTQIEAYGREVDGVRVPMTELWDDPDALRAYRNAVNIDVNSVISRKGLGDGPLMGNTPLGRLLFQFSGYAMGAHSRVMIRGLQENKARFLSGMVVMSGLGGLAGWVNTYRDIDQERGAERRQKWADNPLMFAGEAVDRSGLFPLFFDLSNRTERITGAAGYEYRFNPIKSPVAALGGADMLGGESSRASSATGVFSGIGGPTVGLIEGAVSSARVAADTITRAVGGEAKTPDRETERALATIPFNSYLGARQIVQWLFEGATQ
jgi:surface antigen